MAAIINELTIDKYKISILENEARDILGKLKAWKTPKAKKWAVGDVFSMTLKDGSFVFAQVIDTHLTKKSPTCAVFEIRKSIEEISKTELEKSQILLTATKRERRYVTTDRFP